MAKNWNQAYLENETPWDKGSAAPPLAEFLAKHVVAGRVLVPGCGTGHDVRLLSAQGADVVGMDLSPEALRRAEAFSKAGQESYLLGDFLNVESVALVGYDWVFEHTCLCAIEPTQRQDYVRSLVKTLRPGGHFLAVFFREVSDYSGGGPPHPIDSREIKMLFEKDFERVESFVPKQHYPERPYGAEEVVRFRLK
jgi:SAM-dependent methyltransferase